MSALTASCPRTNVTATRLTSSSARESRHSLPPTNEPTCPLIGRTVDQFVPKPLVISLAVIMRDVLRERSSQCYSPNGTIRFRHSSLIDRTNRSAYALQLGAHAGVRTGVGGRPPS